jgi:catechol 2,3-dioxygenase-like lactoylglutathione lyase family enzyme
MVVSAILGVPHLQLPNLLFSFNSIAHSTELVRRSTAQPAVTAVASIGMTVSNMDQALDFYTRVLTFKQVSDVEVLGTAFEQLNGLFGVRLRVVKLQLGDEFLELTEYLTPKGRQIPTDSRSHDRWFQHIAIVVRDMDQAYQHLRRYNVQHTSTAPQRIPKTNPVAAGIQAFYFKDPDGHNLEIIYFPPGKGDSKWQKPTEQLFLGIDHTAIVVSNTSESLAFYRDLLGLKLAGESMNYGIEQAHLNLVEGARLRISGLRATTGPGVEFLEYLEPQDGRSLPYPKSSISSAVARPNDVVYWQTTFVANNIKRLSQRLCQKRSTSISTSIIPIPEQVLGFRQGVIIRDPDGHAVQLIEK